MMALRCLVPLAETKSFQEKKTFFLESKTYGMRLQVIKLQFFEFQTNKEGNFLMKNQLNISNLRHNRVPYFYIFFFHFR